MLNSTCAWCKDMAIMRVRTSTVYFFCYIHGVDWIKWLRLRNYEFTVEPKTLLSILDIHDEGKYDT